MRFAFGLAGLLVTLGVVVLIMHYVELPADQQAIQAEQHATDMANQISGREASGRPVGETVKFDPQTVGGRLAGMKVTWVDPNGAMAQHFGLAVNDEVVAATDGHGVTQKMSDLNDPTAAQDQIVNAYSTNGQLLVLRSGNPTPITLPAGSTPGNAPGVVPDNPVNDALKGTGIPTH